jgi:hypothetical protein
MNSPTIWCVCIKFLPVLVHDDHVCLFIQRNELNSVYESGLEELFDISEARSKLQVLRNDLAAECEANAKLQRRFDQINAQMRATKALSKIGEDGSVRSSDSSGSDEIDALDGDAVSSSLNDRSGNSDNDMVSARSWLSVDLASLLFLFSMK